MIATDYCENEVVKASKTQMLLTDEVAADIWLFASDENVAADDDGDLIDYAVNGDSDAAAEFGKDRRCDEHKLALNIVRADKKATWTMPMKLVDMRKLVQES